MINKNLNKIIYTHMKLERENPGYLRPTVSSINKRSNHYKNSKTLLEYIRENTQSLHNHYTFGKWDRFWYKFPMM